VSVIDVARAASSPADAVTATATAGCDPVRVVTSSDGEIVWVSARGSNAVLAFSAALLRRDPAHALVANVRVGQAPVGLALTPDGRRLVVADSNRFRVDGATAALTVVDVKAALSGAPAVIGTLPAGAFPRGVGVSADGRALFVTNFDSRELEVLDLTRVP
jgi:DNA-binding beta-propeller fold protein YncE